MTDNRKKKQSQAAATKTRPAGRGKPGRPPKAPKIPAPPVAPIYTTVREALLAAEQHVMAKVARGEHLAHHEARMLRDAWLRQDALHIWPGIEAAAADLHVSVSTLRNYRDQGCPGFNPHDPIPKAPVLLWLLARAHERGGEAQPAADEEIDTRLKLAKIAKLEGQLITEAEERAIAGVQREMAALRQHLLYQVPGIIFDAVSTPGIDRQTAEDRISAAIRAAIEHPQRQANPAAASTDDTDESDETA